MQNMGGCICFSRQLDTFSYNYTFLANIKSKKQNQVLSGGKEGANKTQLINGVTLLSSPTVMWCEYKYPVFPVYYRIRRIKTR